jgi:hypothetical protein
LGAEFFSADYSLEGWGIFYSWWVVDFGGFGGCSEMNSRQDPVTWRQ